MTNTLQMISVPRCDLAKLCNRAQDAALMQALTTSAVRYLARASDSVLTNDFPATLELIAQASENSAIDDLSDSLYRLLGQEVGQ
jgi:hypothetical protein